MLSKPQRHRYAVSPGAQRQPWPNAVPIPNPMRPQLFAGKGVFGDLYECHSMPRELLNKLKNASYIGCGLSADVWDLQDGTVLKITKEDAAIKICKFLEAQRTFGLPQVHRTYGDIQRLGFRDNEKWKKSKILESPYTAIIQTKYDALDEDKWEKIQSRIRHLDLGDTPDRFGRGSDGEAARGQEGQDIAYQLAVVSRKVKKEDPSHPLAHCTVAMSTLYQWMKSGMLPPNAGLDIDHSDNWAQDMQGRPILLDPIFTVNPNPRAPITSPSSDHSGPSF